MLFCGYFLPLFAGLLAYARVSTTPEDNAIFEVMLD